MIRALKDAGIEPDIVCGTSINIMQVLITRSRLAGEPADLMVAPQLVELGLMEFHRAAMAIDAGKRAVEFALRCRCGWMA